VPTYQYACTACAERLEVVQRFTDDPLTICPECGGALRKVYSPVGVVFKGSGFYKTDSRGSRSSSSSAASGSGSSSGDAASPGGSSGGSSGASSGGPGASSEGAAPAAPAKPAAGSSSTASKPGTAATS
jgi:putative FmdB family regulatory protein